MCSASVLYGFTILVFRMVSCNNAYDVGHRVGVPAFLSVQGTRFGVFAIGSYLARFAGDDSYKYS